MPVLELKQLSKHFDRGSFWSGNKQRVMAVDHVSLALEEGKTLAIVGESGSGKSTTARMAMRLTEPSAGSVCWMDEDVTTASGRVLREKRRHIQMVFQDPFASLNPRMKIVDTIAEGLRVHEPQLSVAARRERVADILEQCGVDASAMDRYPHQFSGGQRQRIGIARALVVQPKVLVLDEPVSALDVSVQAQILNLLNSLQASHGFSYLFISHDLSVVRHIAQDVVIMFAGRVVEQGPVDVIFQQPKHPYTADLLASMPIAHPSQRMDTAEVQLLADQEDVATSGCPYRLRCQYVQDDCASFDVRAWEDIHCACLHPLA